MNMRQTGEFIAKQKDVVHNLVQEGVRGETIKDTLPNSSFPLTGEAEAVYFKQLRDFSKTSLAHRIMNHNQEVYEGEYGKQ